MLCVGCDLSSARACLVLRISAAVTAMPQLASTGIRWHLLASPGLARLFSPCSVRCSPLRRLSQERCLESSRAGGQFPGLHLLPAPRD